MKDIPRQAATLACLGASVLATLALSGCSSGVTVTGEYEGARSVAVIAPDPTDGFDECTIDSAVEGSIQTADYPSSHVVLAFRDDATTADITRVVECLRGSLNSGTIELQNEGS